MSFHPNEVIRRARLAVLLLAGTFLFLGAAFFRTQILEHEQYAMQSQDNRLREVPLPAPRGIIYDRNGEIIAENLPGYTVSVLAPNVDSLRATLRRLGGTITITEDDIERAVRRLRREPNRPTMVLSDAGFDVVSVLEEHRLDFPNLIIQATPKRFYPDREAVAAFVGYTAEISEKELNSPQYAGYKAGQQIGKAGLEKQYEAQLRGREGARFVEVDARGRVVPRNDRARPDLNPEAPDSNLRTHIDLRLQRFVAQLFADSALQAGVIAMDPVTGGVLAFHSTPSFDPNKFVGGVSTSYYDSLRNDPRRPLYNKVIQGRYPPASTFKLATAALGMNAGLVTLADRMPVPCSGGYQFGTRYWRCWDHSGHGNVNLGQAIEKSCDVYFYQLGLKLGMSRLIAGGVALGFLERSGIDLPSEMKPEFPYSTDYFDKKYPRGWSRGETLNLSIGQGADAQTVVNMAKFYTALATDGHAATPQFVQGKTQRKKVLNLTDIQMTELREALTGVLERGTAVGSRIQGVMVAGKTGTAQAPPHPDHAWFVGFAPADKPKILVAVMIEFGEHGSTAARYASAIISKYLGVQAATVIQTEG